MFPWILCLLSTPSDDLLLKSFPEHHSLQSSIWWNPVETVRNVEGYAIQEGDILVPATANSNLKNAIKSKKYLWEGGRIPYEFGENFSCFEREQILKAMKVLETKTCVKFVENENQETFIRFQKEDKGCYAPIGKLTDIGGPLPVNLQSPECFNELGIIEHELLHIVGLFHEQSRPDRDEHVTIHWCNIQPHREIDFLKGNFNQMTTYGLPYDYGSLMHYPNWAFSRNGKPTITSKVLYAAMIMTRTADLNLKIQRADANPDMILGQRIGPSVADFEKVLKMYNCKISKGSDGNVEMEFAAEEEEDP